MGRWLIICLIIGSIAVLPRVTEGGQLNQVSISKDSIWRPSGCHMPVAPSAKVYDVVTYNVAVSMFNTYRDEVSAYFRCASAEAEADYKGFRELLTTNLEGIQSNVMSQFDGLKRDLELSRKAFD